jgi:hypothetical protein
VTHTSGGPIIAEIVTVRNAPTTGDPFDVVGSINVQDTDPGPNTYTTASVTVRTDTVMIFHVGGSEDNNSWETPTGAADTLLMYEQNTAGSDNSLFICYGTQDAEGASGTSALTQAQFGWDNGASLHFAIRNEASTVEVASYINEVSTYSTWTNVPSVSVTVPDTCNYLLAFLKTDHQQYLDSVKLNGAHFDSLIIADHGWTVQVWGLKGPTTGAGTVYGYLDGLSRLRFGVCYMRVDTSEGVVDVDYQQTVWGTNGSLTLDGATNGIVVDFYGNDGADATPGASQTEQFQLGGDNTAHLLISTKPGAASVTVTDTSDVAHWVLGVAVSLTAD